MAPNMTLAIMIPVVAFAIWRRVRRSFGRQPIRRKQMIVRIAIFSVIGVALATTGLMNLLLLEGLLGGAVGGVALALLGLRLTRFERDASGGDAYYPNAWIGGVLALLLVGRLAWRLFVSMPQLQDQASAYHGPAMGNSPLTFAVLGLTIGYYIAYYAGLLIHHRRFERAQAAASPVA
jgi:hypothetical protein